MCETERLGVVGLAQDDRFFCKLAVTDRSLVPAWMFALPSIWEGFSGLQRAPCSLDHGEKRPDLVPH